MGIDRRGFLTAGAIATVVAFDPLGIGWVTEAQAEAGTGGHRVPDLDGELVTGDADLAEAADDYGQIVHHRPWAVLRPGSVRDIAVMVRFAAAHGIAVAMRGQGHSVFGQAQAPGGLVIDSRTLATVHAVRDDHAVVDAGVTWAELIDQTIPCGLTPPVATDFIGLSVGGTLSVGGIGGASSHHGLLVDTVLELVVVTGDGQTVTCSRSRNRELFDVVLGGLGQYAIIVRATVRLVPAHTTARVYRLTYATLGDLTAAQRTAVGDGRFSYLEGQVVPVDGGWNYLLEGVAYFTGTAPDDAALLRGLPEPASSEITEMTYFAWLDRITALVDQLKALKFPNPWIDLFLPDGAVEAYVADQLSRTDPATAGVILLYPVPRARFTRPMVATPDSPVVFLFSVLHMVPSRDPDTVAALLATNRAAYEQAVALGGKIYPVTAVPTTPSDWRAHYGDRYAAALRAKRRYDPSGVLTPGQRVFR